MGAALILINQGASARVYGMPRDRLDEKGPAQFRVREQALSGTKKLSVPRETWRSHERNLIAIQTVRDRRERAGPPAHERAPRPPTLAAELAHRTSKRDATRPCEHGHTLRRSTTQIARAGTHDVELPELAAICGNQHVAGGIDRAIRQRPEGPDQVRAYRGRRPGARIEPDAISFHAESASTKLVSLVASTPVARTATRRGRRRD